MEDAEYFEIYIGAEGNTKSGINHPDGEKVFLLSYALTSLSISCPFLCVDLHCACPTLLGTSIIAADTPDVLRCSREQTIWVSWLDNKLSAGECNS